MPEQETLMTPPEDMCDDCDRREARHDVEVGMGRTVSLCRVCGIARAEAWLEEAGDD